MHSLEMYKKAVIMLLLSLAYEIRKKSNLSHTLLCIFRHILASFYFNENIYRDTQMSKDGKEYVRVTYPKFKLGEEIVREVASPPTYGKIVIAETIFLHEMYGMHAEN